MTTIRYFIPEDGDLETQPNVFLAPRSAQPLTLAQIRHSFPIPGRYHFRFKTSLAPQQSQDTKFAVWMDVTDDRQQVPTMRSQIVAKVTRIGVDEDDDDEDDESFRQSASAAATSPAPPPPQQPRPSPAPAHFDIFDQQQPAATTSPDANNLFDTAIPSAPTSGGSLLDMNYSQPTTAVNNDFLGGYPQQQQPPQQQQQTNSFDLGGAFF